MSTLTRDLEYYLSLDYPVELRRSEGHHGFFAFHPDLEGCMAEGSTADEAVANLADSRELWIESRLSRGYPVPEPIGDDYRNERGELGLE